MNPKELRSSVRALAQGGKALKILQGMSQDEIDYALALLSDSESISALKSVLEAARNSRRDTNRGKNLSASKEVSSDLHRLFGDRERFPTVSSIADFARKVFGVNISYQKKSRDRYISNLTIQIQKSPKARAIAQQALSDGELDEKDQAYQTLYNFIRGNGYR